MRIISGSFRGRKLRTPGRGVRPTTDRVREACFSILGPELKEATVLDLYAGSGAVGLEALSRGARHADFVEAGRRSLAALDQNIHMLGVREHTTVHWDKALKFVAKLGELSYDVALADPPYNSDDAVQLAELFRMLRFARIMSIEHRRDVGLCADRACRYGSTTLSFFFS